jgi:type VI protein secretion system component Hcp
VLAWSWGASNSGSIGPGSPPGKVNVQDLALTRNTDGQSPLFFSYMAKGTHLPTVVLVDGSTTITLTDAIVAAFDRRQPRRQTNDANREHLNQLCENRLYRQRVTTCFNIMTNTSC